MKKTYARVTLYLSEDGTQSATQMLDWIAKQDRRRPSWIIRRLIEQEYEKRGGPPLDAPAASQDGPGEAE